MDNSEQHDRLHDNFPCSTLGTTRPEKPDISRLSDDCDKHSEEQHTHDALAGQEIEHQIMHCIAFGQVGQPITQYGSLGKYVPCLRPQVFTHTEIHTQLTPPFRKDLPPNVCGQKSHCVDTSQDTADHHPLPESRSVSRNYPQNERESRTEGDCALTGAREEQSDSAYPDHHRYQRLQESTFRQ